MIPLTEIYKQNKKRRGRFKYLLSIEIIVVKDDIKIPAKIVYVRNKHNQLDKLMDSFLLALPNQFKGSLGLSA